MSSRFASILLGILLGFAGVAFGGEASMTGSGFEDGEGPKWVGGYYVGYERTLQPVAALQFDGITHLMVGAVVPQVDASLESSFFIDAVNGPIWAQAAVNAAHAAGRRAILMVGGAGAIDGWRGAATPANRAAFVANLLAAVDAYGFDGLDLDWEPIEAIDHAPLLALVQALRAARSRLFLSMPVGVVNANFSDPADEAAFYTAISPLLDQVNLMSYQMGFDYEGWHSWFSSPLAGQGPNTPTSITHSVDYYRAAGVQAGKLGVGAGFYGSCYRGVSQPRVPVALGSIVASDGAMSYRNIVSDYLPAMAPRQYDGVASAPWLGAATGQGPQACTYVSYEDAESLAAKGALVVTRKLGGMIVWTISQGHLPLLPAGARDPLLDAIRTAFQPPGP
jgi:chitinase